MPDQYCMFYRVVGTRYAKEDPAIAKLFLKNSFKEPKIKMDACGKFESN